jgi:predicted hydrolase (HD superfamily)
MQLLLPRNRFDFSRKKWKDKTFVAPIHREDIEHIAPALGVDLDEHIGIVLDAMKQNTASLGLVDNSPSI